MDFTGRFETINPDTEDTTRITVSTRMNLCPDILIDGKHISQKTRRTIHKAIKDTIEIETPELMDRIIQATQKACLDQCMEPAPVILIKRSGWGDHGRRKIQVFKGTIAKAEARPFNAAIKHLIEEIKIHPGSIIHCDCYSIRVVSE